MPSCRICKKHALPEMSVKYGIRHHAHHECFLKSGKDITKLPDWVVSNFPYRLIKEYNLIQIAVEADNRIAERRKLSSS